MAEFNNAFKVKKGLDVVGDSALHGNALVDGYITTPTLQPTENSTKVATTEFVRTAITNLINGSPGALDTLNELAQALGDDPNFATTMTNNLALKAPLASPALTGTPTAPTAPTADNSTTVATTAFVKNQQYATLASPGLTGTPTAPTAAVGTNTTQVSTTAFVYAVLAAYGFGNVGAAIPGGTTGSIDSNTIPSGAYQVTASNTGTKPFSDTSGFLLVFQGAGSTVAHQMYYDDTTARMFSRAYASSAWTAWREAAYLDSPTFTGTPAAPTAAADTNTTQLATTAFVIGQSGTANPTMNGTAAAGSSTRFARQDHVHPIDTSRAPLNSPGLTGVPTAPTATPGTNSTQLATTAYADAIAALKANAASPVFTGDSTFGGDITLPGTIASSDYSTYPMVGGGSFKTTANQTGALKVKLPVAYVDSYISFDIDVTEGTTDASFKARVYGYAKSSNSTWNTPTIVIQGGVASRIPNLRLGNDGSTLCVWLGELTDSWVSPNVNISNVKVGYGGLTNAWMGDWALSYVTTFDTVKTGPIVPNKAAFLASPVFTGVPLVPTPSATDNSTQIANTSWVNAAIAASGSTSIVSIPVTSTAMTLTAAQYSNSMIIFTGALSGNTVITVPNTAHAFIAANNTTGSYTLTIKSNGQTPNVQVVQNKANSLFCDTTGVYATSSTTGVQFAKQFPITANTTLDLSYLGSILIVTTSGVTITLPAANSYPGGAGVSIVNRSSGNISVASSGTDTFDAVASPLTVYPSDSYFLESDNASIWHTVWYSNEKSPSFKTSVAAPKALIGGATDDSSNALQVNGSARAANWYINNQATTDSGYVGFGNSNGPGIIFFGSGTATSGVLCFKTAGTERMRVAIGGNVLIGTTTDNGTDKLQVNGTIKSLTGGFVYPDGTTQTTANSTTQPASQWYAVGTTDAVGSFAAGDTAIRTSGFTAPFVNVHKDGLKLTRGQHFTLNADNIHINFTEALMSTDEIEVTTQGVYNPSSTYLPNMSFVQPLAGATFIPFSHVVGFAWLLMRGVHLEPGTDYTEDATGFYLVGFSADGVEKFGVFNLNAISIANALLAASPIITSGALQFSDGSQQGAAVPGRNRIINGDFRVTQRQTAALNASGGWKYGMADRWSCYTAGTGGTCTLNTISGAYNGINTVWGYGLCSAATTNITGSNLFVPFRQSIEAANMYDMVGSPTVISFSAKASVGGQYSVSLQVWDGANNLLGSYVAPFTLQASVAQDFVIRIPAMPSNWSVQATTNTGMTMCFGAVNTGGYQAPSVNQWNASSTAAYYSASGNVNWTTGVNYLLISNVQYEIGLERTPFERIEFGEALRKCQRYFCKTFPYTVAPANNAGQNGSLFICSLGQATGSTYTGARFQYPVQMRIIPSVSTFNYTTGAAGAWHDAAGSGDGSTALIGQSDTGCYVMLNAGNLYNGAAGVAWYVNAAADAEL